MTTEAQNTELPVRMAVMADKDAVEACVDAAYEMYVERMGAKPAPMLADYAALIGAEAVHVIVQDSVCGVIVIEQRDGYLFVENVAVNPDHQGRGLGRRLMQFAEDQARQRSLDEIRLYTNEMMTENLGLYAHLGFEITDRRLEDGYRRVYMRKRLASAG